MATCDICGQQVRHRSLKGHQTSQACKAAAERQYSPATESVEQCQVQVAHAVFDDYVSISAKLHDILDCVQLSGWLFATIQPWGRGQQSVDEWLFRRPAVQSYDIRKLKDLVFQALRKAASYPYSGWDQSLFDAIIVLAMSITFVDGWILTAAHQDVILRLACAHLCTRASTREEWIGRTPCDAFSHVIFKTVKESERWKCEQIMHQGIVMLRSSTYDYLAKLSKDFSETPSRSAIYHHANTLRAEEFAADYGYHVIRISEIAGSVDGS
ncbi:hypothetical protein M409DRAFT_22177 [Zasmidium cellare ATCC 36951]|uniref:Uncharacterized protein n=1 Tax=Zasmidium cellare ATCC 36951 TaxID=1080233 RepID=A0A6A6CPH9_ZASCE|nr:uncharacterized protein M409DRAFT_22177 [Zasmidium cellare ATCC 36951]KAF2167366.1 hypothetical protein M409DRAFT_22177 [Zasmidium cellare ATCC 36951]